MRRSKGLWLAAVSALVASLLVPGLPALGADGDKPIVAPELSAPSGKCAIKSGNELLRFSGFATPGATLHKVYLRDLDADGDQIGGLRDITARNQVSIAADGAISGSTPAGPFNDVSRIAAVSTVMVVKLSGVSSDPGESTSVPFDEVRPMYSGARTAGERLVVVEFSEPVTAPEGNFAQDWLVNGDPAILMSGGGATRTLTVGSALGEDDTPLVRYKPIPTHGGYQDCAGNQLATGGALPQHVALDRTPPRLPSLDSIDGSSTGSDIYSTNPAPTATVSDLTPGHTAELYLETEPGTGLSVEDDMLVGEETAGSSGEVTFPAIEPLTDDGVFNFYAVAVDVNGNRSVDSGGSVAGDQATYILDRVAPNEVAANTTGDTVTVSFDEPIVGGNNDAFEWTIVGCGGPCDVAAVSGSGAVRVLEMASGSFVPNGASITYTDANNTRYTDRAGNPLPNFTSLATQGLIAKVVELAPETGTQSVNRVYDLELTVTDEFGTPIAGALTGVRAVSGPASQRDFDGEGGKPKGVIASCLSGSDGTCSVSYNGRSAGVDTIQAWLAQNPALSAAPDPEPADADAGAQPNPENFANQDVVTIEWTLEGADIALDATPETASGPINQPHVVTVAVEELGSQLEQRAPATIGGVNVDLMATDGPGEGWLGQCNTGADGTCTIAYDSAVAGTDTLQVWIDRNGDDTPDDDLFLDSAEAIDADGSPVLDDPAQDVLRKTWTGITIPHLQISPENSTAPVGKRRGLNATVLGSQGEPLASVDVDMFVVSGPNQGLRVGECLTDATGRCGLTYGSTLVGDDVVRGWVDLDRDDTPNEVTAFEAIDESSGTDDPNQDLVFARWGLGGADLYLDAQPEQQTRDAGIEASFDVALVDQSDRGIGGAPLAAKVVSGPSAASDLDDNASTPPGFIGSCSSTGAGECSFSFHGSGTGVDEVLLWVDADGDGTANEVPAIESSEAANRHDAVSVTWTGEDGDDPLKGDRKIELQKTSSKVGYGSEALVAGIVQADSACRPAEVTVQRAYPGGAFKDVASVPVDGRGGWRYEVVAKRNQSLRAYVSSDDLCDGATSEITEILVRTKVLAKATSKRVAKGSCVKIKGRLKPRKAQRPVALQIRKGGRWKALKRDITNGRSKYSFPVCFSRKGTQKLRVAYAGDAVTEAGRSRIVRLRITRR